MSNMQPDSPANWYPDPQNPNQQRWWDGAQWTERTQPIPPSVDSPAPTPAKKPIFKRVWFWILIVAVIIIVVVNQQNGKTTAPTTSTPSQTQAGSLAEVQASATSTPEPTQTEAAASSITNGDHIVGATFPAGVYRAEVQPGIFELCTVSQKDSSGTVLDLRTANKGSVIFTVSDIASSVVSFSGCQNIGLASAMVRPTPDPITDGYWLVGDELPPGMYQCAVDMTSAIVLGTVTQVAADGSVLDLGTATEGNVIFTVQEAPGSVVNFSGCSTITKAG